MSDLIYLPMDCPICERRRLEWDGRVVRCEKCTTSSEWDGFSAKRYVAEARATFKRAVEALPWRNHTDDADRLAMLVRAAVLEILDGSAVPTAVVGEPE